MIGKRVCYHIGFLMADRIWDHAACTQANKMLRLYEAGLVTLVQRRVKEGVYEYWAIRNRE
jgi:hypothetical protein